MTIGRGLVLAVVLAGAILAAVLLRASGQGNPTVARVAAEPVTQKQLDAMVEHFRLEAKAEGKPFPDEDSEAFRRLRNQLLGLLVYRTELRQAASRLGVRVTQVEVVRRLQRSGEPGEADRDSFEYGSVQAQLLLERISAKVTRGIKAPTLAERAERRNRALSRYLARLRRETQVRYEPGYAPGP
jgi:hypothetical protein